MPQPQPPKFSTQLCLTYQAVSLFTANYPTKKVAFGGFAPRRYNPNGKDYPNTQINLQNSAPIFTLGRNINTKAGCSK
eukprot:593749-Heterocapsa_arctica.AAC.1